MIRRTACIFKTAEQNLGRDRHADNHFPFNQDGILGVSLRPPP